jgi:hypothetical protein
VADVDAAVHAAEGLEGSRARAREDPLPPPELHLFVVGDARREGLEVVVEPFRRAETVQVLVDHLRPLLRRRRPRVVLIAHPRRPGSVEDRGGGSLRVRGREEKRHRPALGDAEEGGSLGSDGVHPGADVVHPRLEVGNAARAVGEAGPALVEQDHAREGGEPSQRLGCGAVPGGLEHRQDPATDEHDVEGPVADGRVGDADVAVLHVADFRGIHKPKS